MKVHRSYGRSRPCLALRVDVRAVDWCGRLIGPAHRSRATALGVDRDGAPLPGGLQFAEMAWDPTRSVRRSRTRRGAVLAGCLTLLLLAGGITGLALRGSAGDPQDSTAAVPRTPAADERAPPRLFAVDSPWNTPLPERPRLDPGSSGRVAALAAEIQAGIAKNLFPAVAATSYSTPVYVVGAQQPKVPVRLDAGAFGDALRRVLAAGVPIPRNAKPAAGTDKHMTVYQPSTDRLWEFWGAEKRPDGWHVRWAGAMQHVSGDAGYYTASAWPGLRANQGWNWGATASSLPVAAGLVTGRELRAGRIDHALAASIPDTCARVFAWPAQRTDGTRQTLSCIPEGARLRVDPAVDVDALGLSRVGRMLVRAAQRYGIIVRDRTFSTVTFYVEDIATAGRAAYGRRVWGDVPAWKTLDRFPWGRLQVLAMKLCTAPPCVVSRR
jgi:hypothetical protein